MIRLFSQALRLFSKVIDGSLTYTLTQVKGKVEGVS